MSFEDIEVAEKPVEVKKPDIKHNLDGKVQSDDPLIQMAHRPKVNYGNEDDYADVDELLNDVPKTDDPFKLKNEPPKPNTDKKRAWYERMFGDGEESPADVEDDLEMDDEMYALSGKMAAEITDEVMANVLQGLHGSETYTQYKAVPDQKEGVAHAWEVYLRWIKQRLTPLTYLLFKLFTVYGIPAISGIFVYMARLKQWGWHWPWGDSWKRKRDQVLAARNQQQPLTAPQTAPPQPQQPVAAPAPQPAKPKAAPAQPLKKTCPVTGKEFLSGNGFPKKSAEFPQLQDMFFDRSSYMKYLNDNGFRNRSNEQEA